MIITAPAIAIITPISFITGFLFLNADHPYLFYVSGRTIVQKLFLILINIW